MRVLVACECSGIVRSQFRNAGHDAWSCDLKAAEDGSEFHYQRDVLDITGLEYKWDLMIAHPPCTFLSSSGLHWNKRRPERQQDTIDALAFVEMLMDAPIPRIAIENPVGCISTKIRPWNELVQPYHFGDDASKQTCFWLKNLPPLMPTAYFPPRLVLFNGRIVERWSNQTDSGQNKLPPSASRSADRAITYPGIAKAMAEQWGNIQQGATP